MIDNVGPWNEFEIVDGYKKGDIVGVRRKADGPNGPVFTPADFEKLPNPLLDDPENPQKIFGEFGDPTKSVLEAAGTNAQNMKFEEGKQQSDASLEQINITRPSSFADSEKYPQIKDDS